MLERIAESVERAADIAKSGLIHAVPQAIHDSIPRPVSLAELGQDFQSLYQKRARQLGITTSIDMPSHLYTRNEAVVRQVLSILVENAIHAMQASGGKLTIRAKTSGQSHLIEVRDTGPGISSHREQTLFTPKPSEGTGLGIGLWLGQSLARSVGGDLQLSHSSKHGSAFMLQIPADQSAQAIPTEAAA
jgi:C4-dicarboxylate-specific signal transduction histidine kinase